MQQNVDALTYSRNLYDYYIASGFAAFWPSRYSALASSILNNIVSAPTVSTYNVMLPISKLNCEILHLSIFNLPSNVKLNSLAKQVYLAHEARYNATDKFVAFSEGNTGLDNPDYIYEWVVMEDGSTWAIDNGMYKIGLTPIIYFKSAVGMLAIYNTSFTKNMASYVESRLPTPTFGYADGIDENGRVDRTYIDKTNGMIIQAALYAINNLPNPSVTPTPTGVPGGPSVTPTPTGVPGGPSVTPTPTGVPGGPSVTPTPTGVPGGPTSTPTLTSVPGGPSLTPSPVPGSPAATQTLSPLTSSNPSPTSSTDTPLMDQLASWFVLAFIMGIVVIGCASFIHVMIGFREKKPQSDSRLHMRSLKILILCASLYEHLKCRQRWKLSHFFAFSIIS